MAKKRTKNMKILGVPVLSAAVIAGLAWWLAKK